MSLIGASGEVRRIEDRAITPFYNSIGASASYDVAGEIADSAWIRGNVPEDAPYGERLFNLTVALAQNCAETGYHHKKEPLHAIEHRTEFAESLLAIRGLGNEQFVGEILGVGLDLWARMTYDERGLTTLATFALTGHRIKLILDAEPEQDVRLWLDKVGMISGGITRVLRNAALSGYKWGRGEELELLEKVQIVAPVGSDTVFTDAWLMPRSARFMRPLSIEETVFKRTLASAELERTRELATQSVLDQALSEDPAFVSS